MDWQYKFSSLTKDTECNLARVKNQLYGRDTGFSQRFLNNGAPAPPETQLKYVPLEQSPGVIAVLQERLDDQGKVIENLMTAVQSLQHERDGNWKIIQQLQSELQDIKRHLAQRGVSSHDERSLEQWRHNVNDDMQELHNQVQLYHARTSDSSSLALNNELYESRRMMREEYESFRRELDTMRNNLMRLELQMTSLNDENSALDRGQGHLNKTLKSIMDVQSVTSADLRTLKDVVYKDRARLEHLQNNYRKLRDKTEVIRTSSVNQNNKSLHQQHVKTRDKSRVKSSSRTGLFSTSSSDSETDTTWPRPSYPAPIKVKSLDTGHRNFDSCDLENLRDMNSSDILPPPKEYSEQKDASSDDDYLLSDLNLSSEALTGSTDETLYLDDLNL